MNIAPYEHCVCRRMGNAHALCADERTFTEEGKKARLVPRQGEQAVAIVLDGCVLQDNQPKCDGLFLWQGRQRKAAILVELKGAHHIPRAFEQLAYVRQRRQEYRELMATLDAEPGGAIAEKAIIVSNGVLTKPEHERLEHQHGIRVRAVVYCEASSPIPDIREYLS